MERKDMLKIIAALAAILRPKLQTRDAMRCADAALGSIEVELKTWRD